MSILWKDLVSITAECIKLATESEKAKPKIYTAPLNVTFVFSHFAPFFHSESVASALQSAVPHTQYKGKRMDGWIARPRAFWAVLG